MKDAEVTIALVSFKTPVLLERCIRSIYRYTKGVNFLVYVVDNGSFDGSREMVQTKFPQVKLIANNKNRFATVAFNQILKITKTPFVLVLSPDVEFLDNAILKMLNFCKKHSQVAAVSCRQIDAKGDVDKTCSLFSTPIIEILNSSIIARFLKNSKLLSKYKYGSWRRDSTRRVEVIGDTILLAKTSTLREVGFYDENIKLFFMENDLCLRMKNAGYSVWHMGSVTVKHLRGQSTLKFSPKQMYKIFEADMLYYYKKHFGIWWWIFLYCVYRLSRLYWSFEPLWALVRPKPSIK